MKNLGAAMAGGNGGRRKDDFYPTTPEPIYALIESLMGEMDLSQIDVWECACGDGAMSRILEQHFKSVVSTDLIDRGYGDTGVDFLKTMGLLAPVIITNPPFKLAEKFIRHGHALGAEMIILLLKSTYWHAASRVPLFVKHPPCHVAPLTFRVDFTGQGSPTMDVSWFFWAADQQGPTTYRPLSKAVTL